MVDRPTNIGGAASAGDQDTGRLEPPAGAASVGNAQLFAAPRAFDEANVVFCH